MPTRIICRCRLSSDWSIETARKRWSRRVGWNRHRTKYYIWCSTAVPKSIIPLRWRHWSPGGAAMKKPRDGCRGAFSGCNFLLRTVDRAKRRLLEREVELSAVSVEVRLRRRRRSFIPLDVPIGESDVGAFQMSLWNFAGARQSAAGGNTGIIGASWAVRYAITIATITSVTFARWVSNAIHRKNRERRFFERRASLIPPFVSNPAR